jgi:plastocyanin
MEKINKGQTGIIFAVIAIILILGLGYFYFSGSISSKKDSANIPDSNPVISSNTDSTTPIGEAGAKTYNIEINNFAFSPSTLTIKVGDSVVWTNKDNAAHTVTSDSGREMNSLSLSNGEIYSHTFENSGTYNYHCSFHTMMKGNIIVR